MRFPDCRVRKEGSGGGGAPARFPDRRVRSAVPGLQGTHPPSGPQGTPRGPAGGGWGASSGRESIFKFPHSKTRKKFQNLDLDPGSTRKSLHRTRWVYVGGEQPEGRERRGSSGGASLCKPAFGGPGGPRVAATLAIFGRESIFKFSHTKSRKKFQNLDLGPGSTRKPLHRTRWVYEGGREAWAGRRWRHQLPPPVQPAWGGCPATAGHPSRRSDRCRQPQGRL